MSEKHPLIPSNYMLEHVSHDSGGSACRSRRCIRRAIRSPEAADEAIFVALEASPRAENDPPVAGRQSIERLGDPRTAREERMAHHWPRQFVAESDRFPPSNVEGATLLEEEAVHGRNLEADGRLDLGRELPRSVRNTNGVPRSGEHAVAEIHQLRHLVLGEARHDDAVHDHDF